MEIGKKIKWLVLGGAALAVSSATVIPRAKAAFQPLEAKYETAKVRTADIRETISASGKIESENQATLQFQTSGLLNWVGVKVGDKVKKWQAIASLDKREIEKDLKKKLLAYMNERWDFEQTQDDYKTDRNNLTLTDAEKRILEKAQFDLDSIVLDVEIKDLARQLATIISPIDGVVTEIDSPIAGVNITPATARFTIIDPSTTKFMADIDEADIGKVRPGQKVTISLDAYPNETFEGEVTKIAFAAITTRGGGTAFQTDIALPENSNQRFKWGMNGDAEVIIDEATSALTIPTKAISERNGKKYVKVIEGKKLEEIEIKTGIESDNDTQVTDGLSIGQIIVVSEKSKEKKR
jgi:HlyD family secretion protein